MPATAGISRGGSRIELRVASTPAASRAREALRLPKRAGSVWPPRTAWPMQYRKPPIPSAAVAASSTELRAFGAAPAYSCTDASTAPASASAHPASATAPGRSPWARASTTGTSAPQALTGETMLIVPVARAR